MVSVISFVNSISHTSIPCDIAVQIANDTNTNVTMATFYKSHDNNTAQDFLIQNGVNVKNLKAEYRFDVAAFHRLRQILRSESIDVLHTHHNLSGSIARAISRGTNTKVMTTEHRSHRSLSSAQNGVNAPTFPFADCVVFNSESTKESVYLPERCLLAGVDQRVIYNGVDTERIEKVVNETERTVSAPHILSIGRLVPVKNHEVLLVAFAEVSDQLPEAQLTLIGDGPQRKKLESLTSKLGVADAVTFTGDISRESVYNHLATGDIFALASRSEGFCVAAVEAMAAGLPVVVSDIPVFHEVVADCGSFADPENPASFAEAITQVLLDENYRCKLSTAARNRALSQFPLERTAQEYDNMYRELTSKTQHD